jgi:hypothetical protein
VIRARQLQHRRQIAHVAHYMIDTRYHRVYLKFDRISPVRWLSSDLKPHFIASSPRTPWKPPTISRMRSEFMHSWCFVGEAPACTWRVHAITLPPFPISGSKVKARRSAAMCGSISFHWSRLRRCYSSRRLSVIHLASWAIRELVQSSK